MRGMSASNTPNAKPLPDPRDAQIQELEKIIGEQTAKVQELEEKIKQLESLLASKVVTKSSKKPHFPENYSFCETGGA